MFDVLVIVAPVFLIILIGYAAGRARILNETAVEGIGAFVFNIALPMLLFHTMATRDVTPFLRWDFLASFYLAGFTVYGVSLVVWSTAFSEMRAERGVMAFAGTFSNIVLLGLPLSLIAFGERALLPILMLVSVHALIYIPVSVVVVLLDRQSGESWRKSLGGAVWRTLRNPIVLTIVGGALYGAGALPLPIIIERTLAMVGGAAGPTALFALGASLSQFKTGGHKAEIGVIVFLKLMAHPFLAWALATQIFALDPLLTGVVVLAAAMPTGVNAFILAQHYNVGLQRISTATLVGTTLSVITVSMLMATIMKGV